MMRAVNTLRLEDYEGKEIGSFTDLTIDECIDHAAIFEGSAMPDGTLIKCLFFVHYQDGDKSGEDCTCLDCTDLKRAEIHRSMPQC